MERNAEVDVDCLLQQFRREITARKRWRIAVPVSIVIAALAMYMWVTLSPDWPKWANTIVPTANVLCMGVAAILARSSRALKSIDKLDDERAVGSMLDLIGLGTFNSGVPVEAISAARAALVRIVTADRLEQLTPLEPRQLKIASVQLKGEGDAQLSMSLILLLGRFGGDDAEAALDFVAAGSGKCLDPKIIAVAGEKLAAVRASLALQQDQAILLRAAEHKVESPLLRPAAGQTTEDSDNLLRATEGR